MTTELFITGHRPNKIGGYDPNHPMRQAIRTAIRLKLISALNKFDGVLMRNGAALGVDQDAAFEAIELGIPFRVYAPCYEQESRWPAESQERYRTMLSYAEEVIYTYEGTYPGAWCMQHRNEVMIDGADVGLAVWNGERRGGTYNALTYASKKGITVVHIDPNNLPTDLVPSSPPDPL